MKLTPLAQVKQRPRHVAVGEFDGVHLGHREVIKGNDTVLTFEPHPQTVVHPDRAPLLLTSLAVKAELIAELGVEELVVIPFDEHFAHQTPREFIDSVLLDALGATHVSVGDNFRFGYGADGNAALLVADGRFETRIADLVGAGGETISSTRFRELVTSGDVAGATALLGAPFRVRGEVVPGDQRGRVLGFPTANIAPDPAMICPGYGVYATRVAVPEADPLGGQEPRIRHYLAATSVGVRPTFGDGLAPLVEAFLLDFTGDLYGQVLTVEFVARLRGEERFDGVEALLEQMNRDVEETRRLLG